MHHSSQKNWEMSSTQGYKTLKKVRKVYQDVKQVIGKIPTKSKINGTLQQMSLHLRAAAQIAETVRFECGVGDTTAVSQLPVPLQMGQLSLFYVNVKLLMKQLKLLKENHLQNAMQMVSIVKTLNSCLANAIVAKFLMPLTI